MNRSPPIVSTLLADRAYPLVKDHVIARTGLAYYRDKDDDLARRLAGRLAARDLFDCASYLALLADPVTGPAEFDELIKDLTIGETFFFRHTELFEALRSTVLPDLIARNRTQRRLRIWSAGCSTGAEAYSLSILLRRDLAQEVVGWDLTIIGTDINRAFLAQASKAVFEDWAFRSTPDELRRECFRREGTSWILAPRFQEGVSFQYHNLVSHPFPSQLNNLFAFDLILCRNVMIYFNQDLIRRALDGFHQSLVEGGWLLVGHAEPNLELFRAFRTVNHLQGAVLYQKEPSAAWQPPLPPAPVPLLPPVLPFLALPDLPALLPSPSHPVTLSPCHPVTLSSSERSDPGLDAVRACADRGDWQQALAGCHKLLAADTLEPLPHLFHGLILEQIGRHAEAEGALRRAIYLDRRLVLAHYYLGLLLQKSHRLEEAARSFHNALTLLARLGPGHAFALADGITAAELARLARMQLDIMEAQ